MGESYCNVRKSGGYLFSTSVDDTIKEGDRPASMYKILCFNANSIGKQPKRRQVFQFLKKQSPDILNS